MSEQEKREYQTMVLARLQYDIGKTVIPQLFILV